MRAFVTKTFPAYTFDILDNLPMENVIKLYATALWICEEEEKAVKSKKSRR